MSETVMVTQYSIILAENFSSIGLTPLHSASQNGHLVVVQALLAAGATESVYSTNKKGMNISII